MLNPLAAANTIVEAAALAALTAEVGSPSAPLLRDLEALAADYRRACDSQARIVAATGSEKGDAILRELYRQENMLAVLIRGFRAGGYTCAQAEKGRGLLRGWLDVWARGSDLGPKPR